MKRESDRYLKLVEWSEEDGCYVGSAPPLIGPCCHGDDEAGVYRQLCQIVDEWVVIHRQDRRPLPEPTVKGEFSGKFVLRVDPGLHKALAVRAAQAGDSLNQFCARQLAAATTRPSLRRRRAKSAVAA